MWRHSNISTTSWPSVAATCVWNRSRKAIWALIMHLPSLGEIDENKNLYFKSFYCQKVCTDWKSSRKIHSNEFIVCHLELLAYSLELDYTPDTDFDAQYGFRRPIRLFSWRHVTMIYPISFQHFSLRRDKLPSPDLDTLVNCVGVRSSCKLLIADLADFISASISVVSSL